VTKASSTGDVIKDIATLDIPRKKNIEEQQTFVETELAAIDSERATIDAEAVKK